MIHCIEHAPFSWTVWRGRVVLLKVIQVFVLWYVVLGLVLLHLMSMLTLFPVLAVMNGFNGIEPIDYLMYTLYICGLLLAAYGLHGLAKCRHQWWIPARLIKPSKDSRLEVVQRKDPLPTSMGGTLPGPETQWLAITRPGAKPKRLAQVYHALDLWDVNRSVKKIVSNPKPA